MKNRIPKKLASFALSLALLLSLLPAVTLPASAAAPSDENFQAHQPNRSNDVATSFHALPKTIDDWTFGILDAAGTARTTEGEDTDTCYIDIATADSNSAIISATGNNALLVCGLFDTDRYFQAKSTDGSEFKLVSFRYEEYSKPTNTIRVVGYRDGQAVSGAVQNLSTAQGTVSTVTFYDAAWNNIDEFRIASFSGGALTDDINFYIDDIDVSDPLAVPTVTGISPASGPTAGGTSVTITGTNFTGATAVSIGGVAATNVAVVDSTNITATTPAGSAGAADVVVTTPGGAGTGMDLFTYTDNAAPTAGFGKAMKFDGSHLAQIPHDDSYNITNNFTIEFWLKVSDLSISQYLVSRNGAGNANSQWAAHYSNGQYVQFYTKEGTVFTSGARGYLPKIPLTDTNWHHIAFTYDGVTFSAYKDGVLTGSYACTFSLPTNGDNIYIGGTRKSDGALSDFADSTLDEVRIWNTCRTPAELTESMYQGAASSASGLVLYCDLNEGSGQSVLEAVAGSAGTVLNSGGTAADGIWVDSVSQSFTTVEDTAVSGYLIGSDADGDALTYSIVTSGAHGTASVTSGNQFTYTPAANYNGSDSFTYKVTDSHNAESSSQTVTLTVTPINDAPTVSATGANPAFTENGSAVFLFSAAAVSSVEAGQAITGLTLTVGGVSDGSSEVLNIDGTDIMLTNGSSVTTAGNDISVSVSVSGSTATVTLSKLDGVTAAAMQTILNAITYGNDSEAPTGSSRTVTITSITDNGGTADGGVDTTNASIASTVTVNAVNDAPTLSGGPYAFTATDEDTTSTAVSVSTILTGLSVSDADGNTLGLAVTESTGNGTWQYSTNNGLTWNTVGAVSNSTALLLAPSTPICYVPDGKNGETASLTFRAWDQTSGSASVGGTRSTANTSTNGESSAFSAGTAQATLTVTEVPDAPKNLALSSSSIFAADTGMNVEVGTLSATDVDNGSSLTYSLVSGTGDTDNGKFNVSGTALQTNAALSAGTYSVRVQVSDGSLTYEEVFSITVANKPAPALTADTSENSVDNDIEIIFTANPDFAAAITGVSFNGNALAASQFTVDTTNNNKLTLHPSVSGNTYLRTPATGSLVIHASDYVDATVSQTITAGAAATLTVTTQPVPGAETGDSFSTQPSVTLKDQYGNICADGPSAAASVTASAAAGTGSWTLGGTASVTAASGVAAFTDLTCTLVASGDGKLAFSCGGLTSESGTFTIPERNSAISPASASFDRYESATGYADIAVTLTLNGNTLTAVKNGANALVPDTDYTVSGNTLTLKKEYLKTLSTGTVSLTFDFSLGVDPALAVTISDSTPTYSGGPSGATNNGAAVIVNGRSQTAGTSQITTGSDGRTTTTVTVDTDRLESILDSQEPGTTVTIPITGGADTASGVLTGDMLQSMADKDATLVIQTDAGSYTIPASEINLGAIAQQLGENVSLDDITVTVSISEPSEAMAQVVENAAQDGGFTLMVPAVEYTITCAYGNQTVTVDGFSAYVERTIAIPDGVDPDKITTGVVVDPDGTVHHVPTRVTEIDGKYYAVISSLTNSTYSVVWNPVEFADVANHWAKDAVNDMGSRMIVTGVGGGNYTPDRSMTRAEFSAIMVRALGLEPGTGESGFSDVAETDWYCGYVQTASDCGIITGYPDGTFGPKDTITREQAMTMLSRAMALTGLEAGLSDGEAAELLAAYGDGSAASAYARDGIAACLKTGITSGTGAAALSPKVDITRAEVAVMVQRLLQKSGLI